MLCVYVTKDTENGVTAAVGCGFLYVIFDHQEEKECKMTLVIFAEAFSVIEMLCSWLPTRQCCNHNYD